MFDETSPDEDACSHCIFREWTVGAFSRYWCHQHWHLTRLEKLAHRFDVIKKIWHVIIFSLEEERRLTCNFPNPKIIQFHSLKYQFSLRRLNKCSSFGFSFRLAHTLWISPNQENLINRLLESIEWSSVSCVPYY